MAYSPSRTFLILVNSVYFSVSLPLVPAMAPLVSLCPDLPLNFEPIFWSGLSRIRHVCQCCLSFAGHPLSPRGNILWMPARRDLPLTVPPASPFVPQPLKYLQSLGYICCWECDSDPEVKVQQIQPRTTKVGSEAAPALAPFKEPSWESHTLFRSSVELTDRLSFRRKGGEEGDHVQLTVSLWPVEGERVLQPRVLWPLPRSLAQVKLGNLGLA